jgi:hypothetical protein
MQNAARPGRAASYQSPTGSPEKTYANAWRLAHENPAFNSSSLDEKDRLLVKPKRSSLLVVQPTRKVCFQAQQPNTSGAF